MSRQARTEGLNTDRNVRRENLREMAKKHRLKILLSCLILLGVIGLVVYFATRSDLNSHGNQPNCSNLSKLDNETLQQCYEIQDKRLHDVGCYPKPVVKNMLSLLSEKDDIGDYEIEERSIVIFQCNDDSSFCGVNGNCTCEPTENGQTNATAIIKFRDRHVKNSEWQLVQRTLNIKNHTKCVRKAV